MDFVHDQLATGKNLRILTDTHSRYVQHRILSSPIAVRMWCRRWSAHVNRTAIQERSGSPTAVSSSRVIDIHAARQANDNGYIRAFNSKLRAECLNAHWFLTLVDAQEKLGEWVQRLQWFGPIA